MLKREAMAMSGETPAAADATSLVALVEHARAGDRAAFQLLVERHLGYDLFNGPDHDEDARAKGWIGEDGFHANEAGGAAAAEALAAVGFELSERPQ